MRARVVLFAIVLSSIVSLAFAQPPTRGVAVTGTVQDQTGAILPGASVQLAAAGDAPVQTIVSDAGGTFHFDCLPAGDYILRMDNNHEI
jgi:hypothetical protein